MRFVRLPWGGSNIFSLHYKAMLQMEKLVGRGEKLIADIYPHMEPTRIDSTINPPYEKAADLFYRISNRIANYNPEVAEELLDVSDDIIGLLEDSIDAEGTISLLPRKILGRLKDHVEFLSPPDTDPCLLGAIANFSGIAYYIASPLRDNYYVHLGTTNPRVNLHRYAIECDLDLEDTLFEDTKYKIKLGPRK